MATDQDFRPDLKGMLGRSFRQANPERYKQAQGDPKIIEKLRNIERQIHQKKMQVIQYFKEHQKELVGQEALNVFEKRSAIQADYPAPKYALSDLLGNESILRKARMNVKAQQTRQLSELSELKKQMEAAVIRNALARNEDEQMKQSSEQAMDAEVSMSNTSPQTQKKSMRR